MRLQRLLRAAAAAALVFASTVQAYAAPASTSLAGHWDGTIEIPGTKMGIDIDFKSGEGGAWSGDISIPAQQAKDLPLGAIKMEGAAVSFAIQGVPGDPTFQGTLAGDKLAGTFSQGGGSFPFALARGAGAADAAKKALDGYDAVVDKMIADWKVPGLAVAIVKGGEVVYAKGFGYRDVAKKLPVTPETLFAIGSSSKAFTTFVMGTLVDEGKLEWEKPVRTFLPGFRMYDPAATENLTPRDLVTHRSGLPRHDLLWYNNKKLSRKEIVERLQYLQPNEQLRAKWQYNNLMFLTAGYLIEVVTGKSWEDNVRERIFSPVGMDRSNFSVAESQKAADFALPYAERKDIVQVIPFRDITTIGPAGSINSSVAEMAKWVRLHLGNGKVGDRQVISPTALADLHAAHMVMGEMPERAEFSEPGYALGWMVDSYRGHARVEHGGNIDGFSALVTLLPQDDMGIVVLTNMNNTDVTEYLVRHTIDRMLALDPIDWSGEAFAKQEESKDAEKEGKAKKDSVRKTGTRPAHKLAEYAGEYEHPGYGTMKVTVSGGSGGHLEMTYNDITAPFEHWHYEVWNGKEEAADPTFGNRKIQFHDDVKGEVTSVTAQFEPQVADIVFTKKPDSRLFDPAYLARFVGEYMLGPETVSIELQGRGLTANVAGQPQYHLVPGVSGDFTLKELSVISIRFKEDAQGNVTGATFIQPQGVFEAPKKK